MLRSFRLESLEHQVYGILVVIIVLPDLRSIYELNKRIEILLLERCHVMNVPYKRAVEQCFRFVPKWIPAFPVAFCVGHKCRDQFKNVLFTVDVRKR